MEDRFSLAAFALGSFSVPLPVKLAFILLWHFTVQ